MLHDSSYDRVLPDVEEINLIKRDKEILKKNRCANCRYSIIAYT